MSCGNKLSNVWTSVLWSEEGLTSFNKNNRVNFCDDKKLKWSFSWCPFWEYIDYEFLVLQANRTRHENDHARDWRREMGVARSRARALPSLNLKKKRGCLRSREMHGKKTSKSIWSPPRSRPRSRIWRSLIMHRARRLFGARTGNILAYLYLDKAYLWRRELELWQYNDPALDLSRCAFLWGFL